MLDFAVDAEKVFSGNTPLDEDVVSAYRETGEGWQTQINADLRRARKLNPHPAASRGGKSAAISRSAKRTKS